MKLYQQKMKNDSLKICLSFPRKRESRIEPLNLDVLVTSWIPAFAGMTVAFLALNLFFTFGIKIASAQVMQSSNYKIETDSVNFGGLRSASATYSIEDTLGEVATGISSSTNYAMRAGYQQMQEVVISATAAANVTLTPSIGGLTGGTANGQTSFTVMTDNPAGYQATIAASTSPALSSATDSFADYVPAGVEADYTFTNTEDNSTFAFTVDGFDIVNRYKGGGLLCGQTVDAGTAACWDGLSTTARTIVSRDSANHPSGVMTTLRFRAASGSSHVQTNGLYTATTTVTIVAL